MRQAAIALATATMILTGCGGDEYEDRESRVRKALNGNEHLAGGLGSRPAWLIKHSWAGTLRNAAFFGYIDNFAVCSDFADAYNDRYPDVSYSCSVMVN